MISGLLQCDYWFKGTSCPMSVIQSLISMCLISSLVLHGGGVMEWLHCLGPKLKLPKALALDCWINHICFLRTSANHLWVCLTLLPLIIQIERSKFQLPRRATSLDKWSTSHGKLHLQCYFEGGRLHLNTKNSTISLLCCLCPALQVKGFHQFTWLLFSLYVSDWL